MPEPTRDDDLTFVREAMGAELDTVLVFSLLRTNSYLSPFINADLRRRNLTSAQLNTLLVLSAAGPDGLLMGEIGRKLVVTKANVTGLIDRLERQELVARSESEDRRATVVTLTDAGVELLERTVPPHAERLAELTGGMTDEEKRTLVRLLARLRRELRQRRREGE